MEYIIGKKIKIKKLILVAPAIKVKTKEVMNFYLQMKHEFKEINNYAEQIIVIYSNDDEVSRIE
jgi:predicted alpha/beta hydrolase family esterase